MTTTLDTMFAPRTADVVDVTGKNLRQRIVMVKQAIGHIGKTATAPPEMGSFKFTPWEAVSDRLGDLLASHGIVLWPAIVTSEQVQAGETAKGKPIWRTKVKMVLDFENADDPKDSRSITWDGEGDDTSDKSTQKAATSAEKYALMKLFMLGTMGEASTDTDASTSEASTSRPRPQTGEGSLCKLCAEQNWLSTTGRPPTFRKSKRGDFQCNGRTEEIDGNGEKRWANHPMPLAEGEEINDDSPINF